jgi:glycoside/pentoside/hexuronide:cation symporter, GPH family
MSQAYTANNRTIHLWAVGAMADYMLYVSFNALILPIYTTGFGLSPVLVGWALMLPRITDGLIDPLIGHLSDNTHTRWGRRRPFIFGTAVVGALVVMAMWWPSRQWPQGAQFAWLLVSSILLFFCYGTFSMSHVAFGYELSDDYHFRTKVVAIRSFYFSIAAIGGGWAYWLALRPVFGGEIAGIRCVSVGIAAIILLAGLTPVFTCRERFVNANRRHVDLWKALRTTLHVRPFVVVLLLRVFQTLGTTLYGAMAFYIGAYSVCGGDKSRYSSLTGIAGIAGCVFSFAMVPLSANLSRWLGKRRGIILGYGAAFFAATVLPFFARPGFPWLLLTYMLIVIPTSVMLTMFMAAVMPDICDLDELVSGERREGLFSAVMAFVSKLENSLCILLGGYLVAFSGFNTKLAQQMTQQPPEVLVKLRLLGFTPLIVFSGVAFAISWFFPITQKMMDAVRAQLEARHATGDNQ